MSISYGVLPAVEL